MSPSTAAGSASPAPSVSPPEPSLAPSAEPGSALPRRLYTDPSLLEAEQELIFERTWQLAGHVSSLPRAGSYLTASAGSQPVLVVRDEEGRLRAYRNVCRHRGSRLLSGSGQCKAAMRCRYHGWTYRFDGTLIGVPEARAFGERLDKSSLGLLPARVEELCGLVFVNLDLDATPLGDLVGDLPERLARYPIASLKAFAPAVDAAARLQALRRRVPRALRLVRRAAARQAEQQLGRAAVRRAGGANAGASGGGPPGLALCVHLSEHGA